MNRKLAAFFKQNETYVVAGIIGIVFTAAMCVSAVFLRNSMALSLDEQLADSELGRVFATGYLRFREDDGSPYLKVELHNGTLWWIKRVEFDFDNVHYLVEDSHAFRPLNFGAVRCTLQKRPEASDQIEYDLRIIRASGYPPARSSNEQRAGKTADENSEHRLRN